MKAGLRNKEIGHVNIWHVLGDFSRPNLYNIFHYSYMLMLQTDSIARDNVFKKLKHHSITCGC